MYSYDVQNYDAPWCASLRYRASTSAMHIPRNVDTSKLDFKEYCHACLEEIFHERYDAFHQMNATTDRGPFECCPWFSRVDRSCELGFTGKIIHIRIERPISDAFRLGASRAFGLPLDFLAFHRVPRGYVSCTELQ